MADILTIANFTSIPFQILDHLGLFDVSLGDGLVRDSAFLTAVLVIIFQLREEIVPDLVTRLVVEGGLTQLHHEFWT